MVEAYSPVEVAVALNDLADEAYAIGKANGFHDDQDVPDDHILFAYARLALINTEVAEATEELRHTDIDWDKFTDELADIIIRTVDLARVYNLDIGTVTVNKMEKNRGRPYKHGKAF